MVAEAIEAVMAHAFLSSEFTGIDFSDEGLGTGRAEAKPARVLANIQRALRPGGVFLRVGIKASSRREDNIGVPLAAYLYYTCRK